MRKRVDVEAVRALARLPSRTVGGERLRRAREVVETLHNGELDAETQIAAVLTLMRDEYLQGVADVEAEAEPEVLSAQLLNNQIRTAAVAANEVGVNALEEILEVLGRCAGQIAAALSMSLPAAIADIGDAVREGFRQESGLQ